VALRSASSFAPTREGEFRALVYAPWPV